MCLSATYLIHANSLLIYAQEPRTEAEEKSYSSYCRAKEAVRYLQHHAASAPVIGGATQGAAVTNGTASRAACITDKTDRELPCGPLATRFALDALVRLTRRRCCYGH